MRRAHPERSEVLRWAPVDRCAWRGFTGREVARVLVDIEQQTRGVCLQCTPDPCPVVVCRHNVVASPSRRYKGRDVVPWAGDTCAIRLAGEERSQADIASVLGVSHQNVAHVEQQATVKYRAALAAHYPDLLAALPGKTTR